MHNLVLIDKRVIDYAAIVDAVDVSNDVYYIVFDVFELGGTGSDGPFAAMQAKISEREQAGRMVFRVRLGPYDTRDEAEKAREKFDGSGIETTLVRIQR